MAPDDPIALPPTAQDLLFREARTANAFTDEPVPDAKLRAIWELVRWAPTASNTQPLRVTFVRTPAGRERLLPLMSAGNREKTAQAPVTAILATDTRFFTHWDRLVPHKAGSGAKLADAPDKAGSMARLNGALQAGYFLLGVRAAGLAAGPMAGFDAAAVDAEFLADGLRSFLVVNVGHPAEDAWRERLPRLGPDEVLTFA